MAIGAILYNRSSAVGKIINVATEAILKEFTEQGYRSHTLQYA